MPVNTTSQLKYWRKKTAFVLLSSIFISNCWAATDGNLDTISQGTFNVTLTIPGQVRLSGLVDFDFGIYTLNTGALEDNQDLCVWTNTNAGNYQVTASGDGAGSAFTMTNGSNEIPFEVWWNDVTGTASNEQLTPAVAKVQTGANTQTDDCSVGGDSANLQVKISASNLISQPNGSYSGNVALLIEPL